MDALDLSFRPATYWTGDWDNRSRLAKIAGVGRRDVAKAMHDDEGHSIPDEVMFGELLPGDLREGWGRIHPHFLGGEFLPPLEPGEVEVARLELASVTSDVLSLRATATGGEIVYRFVDEYWDEDSPSDFIVFTPQREEPLNLGELVEVLLTVEEGNPDRRFALPLVVDDMLLMSELPPESWTEFIRATSPFYPGLTEAFATRMIQKATVRIAEDERADEPPPVQERRPSAVRPPTYRA